jgi:fermentation-respiration switch protein FrsA (DUF1100 family)
LKKVLTQLLKSKSWAWRIARIMIMVGLVVWFAIIVPVMIFEEKFIYFPMKYPGGFWFVASMDSPKGAISPTIEDCYFTAEDGVKLHGWLCTPHRNRDGKIEPVPYEMTLLWFHGNAGNITMRYDLIKLLMNIPVRILIIDYRGYGKSEGTPTEEGIYKDARAAWNYLTVERETSPDRIVIFGKSLGGAPAVDLASRVNAGGLIVQSSFSSAAEMSRRMMPPFIPRFMLRTKMDSATKIKNVHCPKLFIHSTADEVVPYRLGRKLFDAAPEPKEFYEIKGALHNETYTMGGKPYFNKLRSFIHSCAPNSSE